MGTDGPVGHTRDGVTHLKEGWWTESGFRRLQKWVKLNAATLGGCCLGEPVALDGRSKKPANTKGRASRLTLWAWLAATHVTAFQASGRSKGLIAPVLILQPTGMR